MKMTSLASLIGAVALVTGGLIWGLSGDAITALPLTTENADRVIQTSNGNYVRVVGNKEVKDPVLTKTPLGRVVIATELTPQTVCHVLIDYDGKPPKNVTCVMIEHSCDGDSCIYSCLFSGAICGVVDAIPGYLGSTMKEFLDLDPDLQKRFLRTIGLCKGQELTDFRCVVPIGDPRAIVAEEWFVPHKWAGRSHANFVNVKNGKMQVRSVRKKAKIDD